MHVESNSVYVLTEGYSGYNKILRFTINAMNKGNKSEAVES